MCKTLLFGGPESISVSVLFSERLCFSLLLSLEDTNLYNYDLNVYCTAHNKINADALLAAENTCIQQRLNFEF